MAKLNLETIRGAFADHLEPGESVLHCAYGNRQPHMALVGALYILGLLPGVLVVRWLTRHFLVGLTEKRLVVLEVEGESTHVKSVSSWPLDSLPKGLSFDGGGIYTDLTFITDEDQRFNARFHRVSFPGNRESILAIRRVLTELTKPVQ